MTSMKDGTPPALLRNFTHNRVLHQHVVPSHHRHARVAARPEKASASTVEHLEHGFSRVTGRYGFMEQPDAPRCSSAPGSSRASSTRRSSSAREPDLEPAPRDGALAYPPLRRADAETRRPRTRFFNIPPTASWKSALKSSFRRGFPCAIRAARPNFPGLCTSANFWPRHHCRHSWLPSVTTRRVWRSKLFDRPQKLAQSQLIWLLPLIGAAIVSSVLEDEDRREKGPPPGLGR
jgi:hypothetical protein